MNISRLIEITTDTDTVLTVIPSSDCTALTFAVNGKIQGTISLLTATHIALLENTAMLAQLLRTSNDPNGQADQVLERIRLNLRHLLGRHGEFLGGCIVASCQL
jgi:hypothetical protein